ncbi:hypothetical protein IHV25_05965 [Phaeovibrio sulfidiphilus]|uniref:Uncharacterized protein n=1 Tax=Phaeovibrio sulfidiphilus TaxID=1220600 RepID=A0A8J6YQ41_9PROT|nr:hypothetical protein [Phaeovibrio sulfidiphilus]MBE1237192.1 hypothetical protein [Phaeovibrio sulfidiphilus]
MTSDHPTTAETTDMFPAPLFLEDPATGTLCCAFVNHPGSRAVFLGPVADTSFLQSTDGRFGAFTARASGPDAVTRPFLGVVDFQSLTLRLSWDRFPALELVRLSDTVLRVHHAQSGERTVPLDVRSMPWSRKRPVSWMEWPWVGTTVTADSPQAAVLRELLEHPWPWEWNPDYHEAP